MSVSHFKSLPSFGGFIPSFPRIFEIAKRAQDLNHELLHNQCLGTVEERLTRLMDTVRVANKYCSDAVPERAELSRALKDTLPILHAISRKYPECPDVSYYIEKLNESVSTLMTDINRGMLIPPRRSEDYPEPQYLRDRQRGKWIPKTVKDEKSVICPGEFSDIIALNDATPENELQFDIDL